MEYILTVSVAILIGLIGERKWPKWGKFYYGTILGISVIYNLFFSRTACFGCSTILAIYFR